MSFLDDLEKIEPTITQPTQTDKSDTSDKSDTFDIYKKAIEEKFEKLDNSLKDMSDTLAQLTQTDTEEPAVEAGEE